ncbi:MAG: phosphoribosylformylglycinamidine synthase I [Candidatus Latescibacteria bacterium]|nr:phosphoribosylformylglycinamidine synthase I [Candidatus Latescibacterota bacterium]NIM22077.1 phosphoribosylformylglycinamidine synthase I [Candidatus Latescibacterota bacterium]NIM66096.1 phosphoribosylformylglycinamidine synthase I [Candidatus Latescibacterota bacterium]NIO02504.1 phosphoribosylformylglycinamidine synthase I [Candidatus Latescibacterota bacterium]NIO29415.1 phosphoribosylformylglycinamidine synthase I [Candidatus Latescibacterota bacterium]
MAKVTVIQFPGVNCEYETVRACEAAGLEARILRWNASLQSVKDAAAIVLPGGFSYQDRIRAGVVAAKDHIVDAVVNAADKGVPVMGICNGAQILVEGGIVPGFEPGQVELALAPNRMPDRTGYFCTWIRLKRGPAKCVFTTFMESGAGESCAPISIAEALAADGGTIPMPVAHAEGRFLTASAGIARRIGNGERVALYYATAEGEVARDFPENPNGSMAAVAGVTNEAGNVLALMPHPERATWFHQIPRSVGGYWGKQRTELRAGGLFVSGPGRGFFESLKRALE